jgi:hypothetical protein
MAKICDRDALCRELLGIEKKHAKDFARMDEIKSLLKGDADGVNFKITIDGLGTVNVSAPKDEHLDGTKQELVLEEFLALPDKRRQALMAQGLVATVEIWKRAYYGAVTTKLF